MFPELIELSLDNDGQPSCSAIEARERQSPFVNPTLANHALALLARLFRHGSIAYHGAFVNVAEGRAQPMAANPKLWRGMRRRAQKASEKREEKPAALAGKRKGPRPSSVGMA